MEEQGTTKMVMSERKSKGRQKIEIKKIEKKTSRQVTFSKRRAGLFNCAHKLALLTGAQIAILVRSPGNRVFAYGSPNVDTVLERFFGNNTNIAAGNHYDVSPSPYSNSAAASTSDEGNDRFWWQEPVPENMGLVELEVLVSALEELKTNVSRKAQQLAMLEDIESVLMADFSEPEWMVDELLNLDQDQSFFDDLALDRLH